MRGAFARRLIGAGVAVSAAGVASTLGAQEIVEQAARERGVGLLETATGLEDDNLEAPLRALALVTDFGVVQDAIGQEPVGGHHHGSKRDVTRSPDRR